MHFIPRLLGNNRCSTSAQICFLRKNVLNNKYSIQCAVKTTRPNTDFKFSQIYKQSKLKNGPKMICLPSNGSQKTVGFVLRTGPLYEKKPGLSYLISKAAFQTAQMDDSESDEFGIMKELENINSAYDCQLNRDSMFYAFSTSNANLDKLFDIFARTILKFNITEKMLEHYKAQIKSEMDLLKMQRDPELLLKNHYLYSTAFAGQSLSNPIIYSHDQIDSITLEDLREHFGKIHCPSNMMVLSIGSDSDAIHALTQKYFSKEDQSQCTLLKSNEIQIPNANHSLHKIDMANLNLGANSLPELAHILLAFPLVYSPRPTVKQADQQNNLKLYGAQLVLQSLFGGGSSFSAGGPGKGLHSKFYSEGLNQYYWLSHLSASISQVSQSRGMFLIHGACEPEYLRQLSEMMSVECLGKVCRPSMHMSEFKRAVKQLKLSLSLKFEQVPMMMDQIAHDWLQFGYWINPDELFHALDNLTPHDVEIVAKKIIKSPMSIIAMGNLEKMVSVDKFYKDQKELFI